MTAYGKGFLLLRFPSSFIPSFLISVSITSTEGIVASCFSLCLLSRRISFLGIYKCEGPSFLWLVLGDIRPLIRTIGFHRHNWFELHTSSRMFSWVPVRDSIWKWGPILLRGFLFFPEHLSAFGRSWLRYCGLIRGLHLQSGLSTNAGFQVGTTWVFRGCQWR